MGHLLVFSILIYETWFDEQAWINGGQSYITHKTNVEES